MRYDSVVIGGGFYGCRLALKLLERGTVLLLEREPILMSQASRVNVARVHKGYHYPRALTTAWRSRSSYDRFMRDYADCVDDEFPHYYAIAAGSKVSAAEFVRFSDWIGADPPRPAPGWVRSHFRGVEEVFEVREGAFNVDRLRQVVGRQLESSGVQVELGTAAVAVEEGRVFTEGQVYEVAGDVFNCTYAGLAQFAPEVEVRLETVELMLVEPPAQLAGAAVTVMDGPYFGLMPYPARQDLWSLYHVVHSRRPRTVGVPSSGAAAALADAQRILPVMRSCRYVESLFATRALMPRSSSDDSRPILLARTGPCLSVLGSKIDNVYDVEDALDGGFHGLNVVGSTCV